MSGGTVTQCAQKAVWSCRHCARMTEKVEEQCKGLLATLFGAGIVLGGCMQSMIDPASEANLTARGGNLLAATPYKKATIPESYQRHIVEYHRKEGPGTIMVDTDTRAISEAGPNPRVASSSVIALFPLPRSQVES